MQREKPVAAAIPSTDVVGGGEFVHVPWQTQGCTDWGLCQNTACDVRSGQTYAMGAAGERCTCGHKYVSVGKVVQCN